MNPSKKLHTSISLREFDNGYWYADEIKVFAKELGIAHSSKLRKDELEELIRQYIRTGKVNQSTRKNVLKSGVKDYELGLSLSRKIQHYTSNKITKQFIEAEALKQKPGLKQKSGARYRLNRWRDEQITAGKPITYGDLVKQYILLNSSDAPFEKAPQVRYINFLADFLKHEKGATREQAIASRKALKKLDIPKDYSSWKKYQQKNKP